MRYHRVLAVGGLGCLLVALCCVAPAARGSSRGRPSPISVPSSPLAGGQGGILRLPVHVAPWIPLRPAHGGETFYTVSFSLNYTGGPVTLAADAQATRYSSVDDQMIMKVTHPDGKVSTYQDKEFAEALPPMDLSRYFRKGVNLVEVMLRDVYGDVMSCTDLWLTDKAPAVASLPLVLFEGVVPETAWPAAEANATVTGPPPGAKVMLAGDPQGKTGTWATGRLAIHVTRADGSTWDTSHDYRAPKGPPQLRPPADVSSLFGPGTNAVNVTINGEGAIASSPIWLALAEE